VEDKRKRQNSSFAAVVKKSTALLLLASLPTLLLTDAKGAVKYTGGEDYFNEKQYDKALPLLEEEANNGSKAAMYQLAHMYENGLGVEVDYKKSSYWYKQASSAYHYAVVKQEEEEDKSFFTRIDDQMDPATGKKGREYALQKLDTDTPETKSLLGSLLSGNYFGLESYKTNYFLPISYATHKYPRRASNGAPNQQLTPLQKNYEYYDNNTEVEFQLSLKKPLTYNLFGWNEYIDFAYTQKVWWQLYSDSGPFRETNYLPEIFMNVPTSEAIDEASGLKAVKFGFLHESNGQDGYRSRSWNRLYVTGLWQWDNLFLATRVWYRIPESLKSGNYYNSDGTEPDGTTPTDPNAAGDDNPHMYRYMGYGDINIEYLIGKHQVGSMLRYNFGAGGKERGAVEAHWSYPFFSSANTFWYAKVFSGYGESMIDYNRNVTKTSFGFSFSRGLF